jgi:hypothetical protein
MKLGAHPNTNGLAPIQAEWEYSSNDIQVHAFINGYRFPEIQSLLNSAFGEPDSALGSRPARMAGSPGIQEGWYNPRQAGVAIQFIGWTNESLANIMTSAAAVLWR